MPRAVWLLRVWPAVLGLPLAIGLAAALEGQIDLANQAMLFVLVAVLGGWRLTVAGALAYAALCVLCFDLIFVPPRGRLEVQLVEHGILLLVMLVLAGVMAGLTGRLRAQARAARRAAAWALRLQALGERLRDAAEPSRQLGQVAQALTMLGGAPACLVCLRDGLPRRDDDAQVIWHGQPGADERAGLWLCLRGGQAFGRGTGRHDDQPAWYLPLRASGGSQGAALVRLARPASAEEPLRAQAQALADLLGAALQRAALAREAEQARSQAQGQAVRNTLLAAISHDYRTPLAVILGAASSLREQGERLPADQREHLAEVIVDQVGQLDRMTDNTLQLARLDAPGVQLRLDWESAEELVGTALRQSRAADPGRRVRARLQPGMPLLRCDALLVAQMLDNLLANALKYAVAPDGAALPIELLVRWQQQRPVDWVGDWPADGWIVLAVRDRGPGVPPALREHVFGAFQRGQDLLRSGPSTRGAGVGLAVCRAIARAHGGELRLRARAHGGSSFECWLPHVPQPPAALQEPDLVEVDP